MKKIFALLLVCILSSNCVIARDYAKLQIKELKHAQKYNTADKYHQNEEISKKYEVSNTKNVKLYNLSEKLTIQKNLGNSKVLLSNCM